MPALTVDAIADEVLRNADRLVANLTPWQLAVRLVLIDMILDLLAATDGWPACVAGLDPHVRDLLSKLTPDW